MVNIKYDKADSIDMYILKKKAFVRETELLQKLGWNLNHQIQFENTNHKSSLNHNQFKHIQNK